MFPHRDDTCTKGTILVGCNILGFDLMGLREAYAQINLHLWSARKLAIFTSQSVTTHLLYTIKNRKMVADSNAPVQDKALDALIAITSPRSLLNQGAEARKGVANAIGEGTLHDLAMCAYRMTRLEF
ncbi:hypothetical protein Tco_1420572 [Tanacetum coccineum]